MQRISRVWWISALVVTVLFIMQPASAQRIKRYRERPETQGIEFLVEVEKGVFKLTNEMRRKNALPPLTDERLLRDIARDHSVDMLMKKFFSHVNPDGKSPHERIISEYPYALTATGENIWGADGSEPLDTGRLARIIVDTWMSSPGHRQNILNSNFTDIGVGVAAVGKQIRATQVFARIKNQ
ncbi:MAG: CAP domain-containing protein [Deltaproteobacteria bacterium]|nr:CAP domain-containing protein [Deltaproteobacteria bacterium]